MQVGDPVFGGKPPWEDILSAVYRLKIFRVRPDGSGKRLVETENGYDIQDLNVLADDRTVVYTLIPSDRSLWRHRHDELTAPRVALYTPKPSIEWATVGGSRHVLIADGHLAAVQP